MLAPPVGLNVYVVNGMARDVPMNETYKGVMPFLASDVLRIVLLLFFPSITLTVSGEVDGVDEARFVEIAQAAKDTCPVSKALAGTSISLEASLA